MKKEEAKKLLRSLGYGTPSVSIEEPALFSILESLLSETDPDYISNNQRFETYTYITPTGKLCLHYGEQKFATLEASSHD